MYKDSFAKKIKKAREDTGLTQRDVAAETEIHPSTIAKYESAKLEPDLEKLGILADFYGVSVDWLLGTAGTNNIDKNDLKKMTFESIRQQRLQEKDIKKKRN
ncbi:MAG: helix-turn-helix domain-containing protein [Ruminococcus sp.]|jgi:transcriptional regulator with XRE-family HTH domain|nr:helix-turn-helix domain-containing protein [Ruminococcus sp.]